MKKSVIVVFDSDALNVLVCFDRESGRMSFVGGECLDGEKDMLDSAYRVLFERTGATASDITLCPVGVESYRSFRSEPSKVYLTAGILKRNAILTPSRGYYVRWLELSGVGALLSSNFEGYGRGYSYYLDSAERLGIEAFRFDN